MSTLTVSVVGLDGEVDDSETLPLGVIYPLWAMLVFDVVPIPTTYELLIISVNNCKITGKTSYTIEVNEPGTYERVFYFDILGAGQFDIWYELRVGTTMIVRRRIGGNHVEQAP